MDFGRNINLTAEDVHQAICKRALEVAKARGIALKGADDVLDFVNRAKVFYMRTDQRPIARSDGTFAEAPSPSAVTFDAVSITVED
jgi:hypothetical protein